MLCLHINTTGAREHTGEALPHRQGDHCTNISKTCKRVFTLQAAAWIPQVNTGCPSGKPRTHSSRQQSIVTTRALSPTVQLQQNHTAGHTYTSTHWRHRVEHTVTCTPNAEWLTVTRCAGHQSWGQPGVMLLMHTCCVHGGQESLTKNVHVLPRCWGSVPPTHIP